MNFGLQSPALLLVSRNYINSIRHASRRLPIRAEIPVFDNVNFPTKHRLPIYPKAPSVFQQIGAKPPKEIRNLYKMQGEEIVHNKLQLEQFGIVAIGGGLLESRHFDMMRHDIGRFLEPEKCFAIYRVDPPYKPRTNRGVGRKLGGGKGSIHHYVTPIKAGRVIVEVAGNVLWDEVQPWLARVAGKMPFQAMAVSQKLMEKLDAEEKRLEEANENPYTFEWLVRNNMFDCQRYISPRDKMWFGKFIYKDRDMNMKWNLVRQKKYHFK